MADKEALLRKAQLLYKAKQTYASKFPGAEAAGVVDGPTPAAEERIGHKGRDAAMQALGRGASGGYLPNLQAMAEPAFNQGHDVYARLKNYLTGSQDPTNFSEGQGDYTQRRDNWDKYGKELKKEYPWTSGVMEGVGGVSAAMAPAALASRLMALGLISRAALPVAASTPGKIAMGMTGAGAYGALADPGNTPGEISPLQIDARIKNAKSMASGAGLLNVGLRGLGTVGSKMFSSSIHPVEVAGEKFNKPDIVEEVNSQGIWWPPTMAKKLQQVVDDNMAIKEGLIDRATDKGGEINVPHSISYAQKLIEYLKSINNPDHEGIVKRLQNRLKKIDSQKSQEAGTVFTPKPAVSTIDTPRISKAGEVRHTTNGKFSGDPETRYFGEPVAQSKPIIVPKEKVGPQAQQRADLEFSYLSPEELAAKRTADALAQREAQAAAEAEFTLPTSGSVSERAAKVAEMQAKGSVSAKDVNNTLPVQGEWNVRRPGPSTWQGDKMKTSSQKTANYTKDQANIDDNFSRALALGRREAVENSVEQTLGKAEAEVLKKVNASTGKILSTGKAQEKVQLQGQRDLNKILTPTPTGTEAIVSGAVSGGHIDKAILTAWFIKAMRAAQMSQMPVGYGLKNYAPKAADIMSKNPWSSGAAIRPLTSNED